jgi:segregation and condensation protein B
VTTKTSTPEKESEGDYSTAVRPSASEENTNHLAARVEALLFVSPAPVSISQLATSLEASPRLIQKALDALDEELKQRGLRLQHHRSLFQLTTAPELSEDVERFLQLDSTSRLTPAALEVISIIAYQQPVTRPQIDAVRGVNSDSVLRTLLRYGLIEEIGRSESPGRPILYATTTEFLQQFGIESLDQLPPLNLESLPPTDEINGSGNQGETQSEV